MNDPWRQSRVTLLAIGCIANGMGCHSTRVGESNGRTIVWMIDESHEHDSAVIRFHFPPPHDAYAGEVRRVQGILHLDEEFRLGREGGWFSVDVMAVTLGEPDLDENVRNNVEFLYGKKFPISRFHLREIAVDRDRHIRGRRADVTLHGDFSLKGVSIPLSVPAMLEVAKEPNGRPGLDLLGSFVLEDLRETFGISGPGDEDDPAGNRLLFEFQFRLVRRPSSPQLWGPFFVAFPYE